MGLCCCSNNEEAKLSDKKLATSLKSTQDPNDFIVEFYRLELYVVLPKVQSLALKSRQKDKHFIVLQ